MIAIGSDHGGYELKKEIIKHLTERGLSYKDFGTDSTESCDYPVYGGCKCSRIGRMREGNSDLRHGHRNFHHRKQNSGDSLRTLPRLFFR